MRKIFVGIAALLFASPGAVGGGFDAAGAGAFGGGVMQGYQDGQMRQQYLQMQQLCLQAMQNNPGGGTPPACAALSTMQWPSQPAPPVHCTTTYVYNTAYTTCR